MKIMRHLETYFSAGILLCSIAHATANKSGKMGKSGKQDKFDTCVFSNPVLDSANILLSGYGGISCRYEYFGAGTCSPNPTPGSFIPYGAYGMTRASPAYTIGECEALCMQFAENPYHRGIELDDDPVNKECQCLFDVDQCPPPPQDPAFNFFNCPGEASNIGEILGVWNDGTSSCYKKICDGRRRLSKSSNENRELASYFSDDNIPSEVLYEVLDHQQYVNDEILSDLVKKWSKKGITPNEIAEIGAYHGNLHTPDMFFGDRCELICLNAFALAWQMEDTCNYNKYIPAYANVAAALMSGFANPFEFGEGERGEFDEINILECEFEGKKFGKYFGKYLTEETMKTVDFGHGCASA